ncbi:hypothetical protein [Ruegeria profundi]|uniref:hypothetical protein n=1 Tax=Ruegeria profundi TaxID=1685378 RepID=UPI0012FDF5E3|nr:hypothetical protein [Ruegeria profundi]
MINFVIVTLQRFSNDPQSRIGGAGKVSVDVVNYNRGNGRAVLGIQTLHRLCNVKTNEKTESNDCGGQHNPINRDSSRFMFQKKFNSFQHRSTKFTQPKKKGAKPEQA